MSLHPGVLFHFTKKEAFLEILKSNFKASFARESLLDINTNKKFYGVPMVSFCDLKISELKDHMKSYGEYGIGLKKEWAYNKKLHPVLYMNRHHSLMPSIYQSYLKIDQISYQGTFSENALEELTRVGDQTQELFRYMKYYESYRNVNDAEETRYADEREWRYVPKIYNCNEGAENMNFLSTKLVDDEEWKASLKDEWNKKLRNQPESILEFEPDDVEYIVLLKCDERKEFITHIRNCKEKYKDEQVDRLTSRILTYEQIVRDV